MLSAHFVSLMINNHRYYMLPRCIVIILKTCAGMFDMMSLVSYQTVYLYNSNLSFVCVVKVMNVMIYLAILLTIIPGIQSLWSSISVFTHTAGLFLYLLLYGKLCLSCFYFTRLKHVLKQVIHPYSIHVDSF